MKRKRKNLNIKKLIILLLFVILILYLYTKYNYILVDYLSNNINILPNSNYEIIKQDSNNYYSGIGQKQVKNKDGYFTTFTTEEKNQKTYNEYKQNGNFSWSNKDYFGGIMSDTGCGITAISTILSGYDKKYTPEDLRKKYYPVLDGTQISNELSKTFGIDNSDFFYDESHLSNKYIENHLKTNRPILICVWNKPNNNRWTTDSHYMVLLATDGKGLVYVSNPNGLENDSKSSGWYNINEITPYIAKALYIESYQ